MRKGIELKAKLLKTAVKLFEVHGYTNTTTRTFADKAIFALVIGRVMYKKEIITSMD